MGILGQELGSRIGSGFDLFVRNRFKHKKEEERIGRVVGKIAGRYLPLEKGRIVKPIRGKTNIIVAHKGKLVIPKHLVKMYQNR